jgi:hypothetical protein
MGRSLGLKLPDQIIVIAIEARVDYNFSENLTPPIAAAVPNAANKVLDELDTLVHH